MTDRARAVLFDLGNVLMDYDVRRITDGIAELLPDADGEEILGGPGSWDALAEAETGEMDAGELRDMLNRRFGLSLGEPEWAAIWARGIIGPMAGMRDLVERLRPDYDLGCLSNTISWHWEEALRRIPVLELLDHFFLSYELGYRKPDPEIYRIVLGRLGLPAEAVVFIDDRPENVEGAAKLGIRSMVFTDLQTLSGDLQKLGILLRSD